MGRAWPKATCLPSLSGCARSVKVKREPLALGACVHMLSTPAPECASSKFSSCGGVGTHRSTRRGHDKEGEASGLRAKDAIQYDVEQIGDLFTH